MIPQILISKLESNFAFISEEDGPTTWEDVSWPRKNATDNKEPTLLLCYRLYRKSPKAHFLQPKAVVTSNRCSPYTSTQHGREGHLESGVINSPVGGQLGIGSECTVCSRLRNNGFFSAFLPAEVSPHFKAWSGSSSASSFSPSTGRQQSPDLSIRPSPPSTITHLLTSLSFSAFAFPLWASDEVELINHLQSFFFFFLNKETDTWVSNLQKS